MGDATRARTWGRVGVACAGSAAAGMELAKKRERLDNAFGKGRAQLNDNGRLGCDAKQSSFMARMLHTQYLRTATNPKQRPHTAEQPWPAPLHLLLGEARIAINALERSHVDVQQHQEGVQPLPRTGTGMVMLRMRLERSLGDNVHGHRVNADDIVINADAAEKGALEVRIGIQDRLQQGRSPGAAVRGRHRQPARARVSVC